MDLADLMAKFLGEIHILLLTFMYVLCILYVDISIVRNVSIARLGVIYAIYSTWFKKATSYRNFR